MAATAKAMTKRVMANGAVGLVLVAMPPLSVAADVLVDGNVNTGLNLDALIGSTIDIDAGVTVSNGLYQRVITGTGTWTLTNYGSIAPASDVAGEGIRISGGGSSVHNHGSVRSGSNAIVLDGGGSVVNATGATIDAGSAGISIGDFSAGAGTVTNSGIITQLDVFGTGYGYGDLVILSYGGKVTNTATGEILASNSSNAVSVGQGASREVENAGKIVNSYAGGYSTGVLVQGGPSTIINAATGTIEGGFNGIYASGSAPLTFANHGFVRSTQGNRIWP